ncbi:MAG: C-GCAxxG-C-C family protein [Pseudomonadota bacterium]
MPSTKPVRDLQAHKPSLPPHHAKLVEKVGTRAANLFETKQLLCAEAILRAVAEVFGGPLTPEQAAQIGTPFCMGIGGAGCTCGALSGAVASVGIYLGRKEGGNGAPCREYGKQMHDAFKSNHKSTCCRILTRNLDAKTHFAQCLALTEEGARMATEMLLEHEVQPLDTNYLPSKPDTRWTAITRNMTSLFK